MRVRWAWLATAVAMLAAGALALATSSTYGCEAGGSAGACGPGAVDRVREVVIVAAALAGATWAGWRGLRSRR